jgi:hypothetical protein
MAAGVRAIIGLQDVRAGGTVKTYKTCGQVATVQRQHCSGARRLRQHNATLLTVHSIAGLQDMTFPTPLKTSFAYS